MGRAVHMLGEMENIGRDCHFITCRACGKSAEPPVDLVSTGSHCRSHRRHYGKSLLQDQKLEDRMADRSRWDPGQTARAL
jgi:hypothetical protein